MFEMVFIIGTGGWRISQSWVAFRSLFISLGTAIRRRPWITACFLVLLTLVGTGVGLPLYALYQWKAAQEAVQGGRFLEAQDRLKVCLFLWPRSAQVHFLAAKAARLRGDFATAESHLNQCWKLPHGDTSAVQLENLLMRVQRGEVDEVALELMALVDNNHPESIVILETLSRAYLNNHRYGPGRNCLDRWIELAPDAAQAYFWRGWVKERNDSFEGAVKDYETAVELAPQVFLFRHRAAEILLERSNPPLARPHLEYLQHHFPNRPEVKALLGHCRFVEGKWEEARPLLEEAVKKMPDHPPLLTHLAKLDLQEGRPEEAEKWLRHLLELEPFDLDAQNTLVISLRQQGRQEEAAAAQKQYENSKARLKRANDLLKEMAEKPPEEAGKPSEVGQILISIGRDHIGLFWLDRALLLDPGHQPTHQALADYFERKGQKVQADLHRRYLKEPPSQRR